MTIKPNLPLNWRARRRARARSSSAVKPGVSSIYMGASESLTTASFRRPQCSSCNLPVFKTLWSKRPTEPSIRMTSCAPPISIENTATGNLFSTATCSAILIEKAVLPMEGRPATMIKSPGWRPDVFLSRSIKPVDMPVTSSGLSRE